MLATYCFAEQGRGAAGAAAVAGAVLRSLPAKAAAAQLRCLPARRCCATWLHVARPPSPPASAGGALRRCGPDSCRPELFAPAHGSALQRLLLLQGRESRPTRFASHHSRCAAPRAGPPLQRAGRQCSPTSSGGHSPASCFASSERGRCTAGCSVHGASRPLAGPLAQRACPPPPFSAAPVRTWPAAAACEGPRILQDGGTRRQHSRRSAGEASMGSRLVSSCRTGL